MIALAGAHRVGKTTLANLVSKNTTLHLKELNTGDVFKTLGLDVKSSIDPVERLMLQQAMFQNYKKHIDGSSISKYIFDRSPLDYAAYTLYHMRAYPEYSDATNKIVKNFLGLTEKFAQIFLVQPGIPPSDYPTSAPYDEQQIQEITDIIKSLSMSPDMKSHMTIIAKENTGLYSRMQVIHDYLVKTKEPEGDDHIDTIGSIVSMGKNPFLSTVHVPLYEDKSSAHFNLSSTEERIKQDVINSLINKGKQ